MAEATATTEKKTKTPKVQLKGQELINKRAARRHSRVEGRKKTAVKLATDKEFAKTYFEGRSKRATDKKSGFRKKKARKK